MAITRTAMIDDDGSGTTGTILNNAWKQELYNQIDAAAYVVPGHLTWTVIWTLTGGSGLFLGNGTLVGRYMQEGKRITMTLLLIAGTTTNFGSGGAYYGFGLPALARDAKEINMIGSIWSTAGLVLPAVALGVDTSTINLINMTGQPLTPTVPSAWWGPNARIQISGSYFTA